MCVPEMAWAEASSVRVDAQEVPVNGNWYEYKISEGEYVYCPIVIKDNGRLDVSVQINFEGHHYVGLLDQNYEAVRRDSVNPPEEELEPEIAIPKIEIAVGETTELTTDSSSDNISWGSTDRGIQHGNCYGLKIRNRLGSRNPHRWLTDHTISDIGAIIGK